MRMTHPADNPTLQAAVRRAVYLFAQEVLHRFSKATLGEIAEYAGREGRGSGRKDSRRRAGLQAHRPMVR